MAEEKSFSTSPLIAGTIETRIEKKRWIVLILITLAYWLNAVIWLTFAPIDDSIQQDSGLSEFQVDLLSLSGMALYFPGIIMALLASRLHSTSLTFNIANTLALLGTSIRSIWLIDTTPHTYPVLLIGQSLCALTQPMYLTILPSITAKWFGQNELVFAMFVAALANPLGAALGQLLSENLYTPGEISTVKYLLLPQAILAGIICIITLFFIPSKPKNFPTISECKRAEQEEQSKNTLLLPLGDNPSYISYISTLMLPLLSDTCKLLSNISFITLSIPYVIGVIIFNAIVSVPRDFMGTCIHHTGMTSSSMVAILLLSGVCGSILVSLLLEATRKYRLTIKIAYFISASYYIGFFIFINNTMSLWGYRFIFVGLGGLLVPLFPLTTQNLVEFTYPLDPQLATSLLSTLAQCISAPAIMVLGGLMRTDEWHTCHNLISTPMGLSICGAFGIACLLILFFNAEPMRTIAMNAAASSSDEDTFIDNHLGLADQTASIQGADYALLE